MSRRKPEPAIDALVLALQPLGPVRARAMFGGHGVFLDDRMFALIAGDQLYFKADAATEDRFRAVGGEPFVYSRKGTPARMRYWSVPFGPEADLERWLTFAQLGLDAAHRARRPRKAGEV